MRGGQQTASLWGESLELYYEISTATTHPCGSKHAVLFCFFHICLSFTIYPHPPCCHCHLLLSHIQYDSQHLTSPLLGQLSDWLPYLLFNVVGNAAALLWVTALRLDASLAACQAGERRPKWEEEKEMGLFHAQQEGRIERQRERGGRGRGEKLWVSQKTCHFEIFIKK